MVVKMEHASSPQVFSQMTYSPPPHPPNLSLSLSLSAMATNLGWFVVEELSPSSHHLLVLRLLTVMEGGERSVCVFGGEGLINQDGEICHPLFS